MLQVQLLPHPCHNLIGRSAVGHPALNEFPVDLVQLLTKSIVLDLAHVCDQEKVSVDPPHFSGYPPDTIGQLFGRRKRPKIRCSVNETQTYPLNLYYRVIALFPKAIDHVDLAHAIPPARPLNKGTPRGNHSNTQRRKLHYREGTPAAGTPQSSALTKLRHSPLRVDPTQSGYLLDPARGAWRDCYLTGVAVGRWEKLGMGPRTRRRRRPQWRM